MNNPNLRDQTKTFVTKVLTEVYGQPARTQTVKTTTERVMAAIPKAQNGHKKHGRRAS